VALEAPLRLFGRKHVAADLWHIDREPAIDWQASSK
jgi:hypothetical protein